VLFYLPPDSGGKGGVNVYQALYRKWRPRTFDDVVGQAHITETLKNQVITDRLSHAYLFIGTRGTGKTTCAKILAKAVNCEHPVNGNPCNVCRICRGIDDGSVMDVVEMDAASNNGVDNVRQLRDEAVFSPAAAKKRVYIVDEVHMLSSSAFNALLKILEEPPEHLMFILATTELNKVPATILSRCQRHSFKRLDTASVIGCLLHVAEQEKLNLTKDAAALIAGLCDGGMRDALSMLDQCSGRDRIDTETVYSALGLAGNREIGKMLESIARHDTASAIGQFSQLWQGGKDPATLLGELSSLMRDILMCAVAPKGGQELLSGGFDAAMLDSFKGVFSSGMLIDHLKTIQSALSNMRSGQARTVCELCLITLCEPALSDSLPVLQERLSALEQLVRSGAAAAVPAVPVLPPEAPPAAPPKAEPPARKPVQAEEVPPFCAGDDVPPPPTDEDAPPFDPTPMPPPEAPVPKVIAPEPLAPAPANPEPEPESAAAPGGDLWSAMLPRLGTAFPAGIAAILSDASQVGSHFSGDTLTLVFQNIFSRNMVDRPDTTSRLGAMATEIAGFPVQVKTASRDEAPKPEPPAPVSQNSKLDELGKFDIVKFK